jgi:hypothetical protein
MGAILVKVRKRELPRHQNETLVDPFLLRITILLPEALKIHIKFHMDQNQTKNILPKYHTIILRVMGKNILKRQVKVPLTPLDLQVELEEVLDLPMAMDLVPLEMVIRRVVPRPLREMIVLTYQISRSTWTCL